MDDDPRLWPERLPVESERALCVGEVVLRLAPAMTDDEFERFVAALPHTSLPELVDLCAGSIVGDVDDPDED